MTALDVDRLPTTVRLPWWEQAASGACLLLVWSQWRRRALVRRETVRPTRAMRRAGA